MQRESLSLERNHPGEITPMALSLSLRSSTGPPATCQLLRTSTGLLHWKLAPLWDTHAHSNDNGSQVTVSSLNCTLWMFLGPGPLLQLWEGFHLHARCQMEGSSELWVCWGARRGQPSWPFIWGFMCSTWQVRALQDSCVGYSMDMSLSCEGKTSQTWARHICVSPGTGFGMCPGWFPMWLITESRSLRASIIWFVWG